MQEYVYAVRINGASEIVDLIVLSNDEEVEAIRRARQDFGKTAEVELIQVTAA